MKIKIALLPGDVGGTYRVATVSKRYYRDRFVQTDWDYPATAALFGHTPRHNRGCRQSKSTDGTVACRGCGLTATECVTQAAEYLDAHIGRVISVESDRVPDLSACGPARGLWPCACP